MRKSMQAGRARGNSLAGISPSMKFSPLGERVAGEGADACMIHYEARAARERGEDVIVLSIGDPDLETPAAALDCAIAKLNAHDVRYTPAAGRMAVRSAIARAHSEGTGQQVGAASAV